MFKPKRIEYPITVKQIEFDDIAPIGEGWRRGIIGKFVAIRPVKSICPDEKTYLGSYIGEVPISQSVSYNLESQVLTFSRGHGNPAIFVFALNRVVMGYESWWGIIDNEDQLKQITDADIKDIWYVKALRELEIPSPVGE